MPRISCGVCFSHHSRVWYSNPVVINIIFYASLCTSHDEYEHVYTPPVPSLYKKTIHHAWGILSGEYALLDNQMYSMSQQMQYLLQAPDRSVTDLLAYLHQRKPFK